MSKLRQYIEKVKEYKEKHPNISEIELIRYVYLDLGKRFSFNIDFIPFGNTKKRHEIYSKSRSFDDLEECMESNIIICKSLAYILEEILQQVGIDITTEVATEDTRKYPHVYNVVNPKNGEKFIIDLQNDLYNIQAHAFTTNFGISTIDGKTLIIPRFEQEQIDRKLGYIDNENYYTDDYIYVMKSDIGLIEDFGEKVRFVLENIDIYENPRIGYANRMWHHAKVLEQLFTSEEFRLGDSSPRIKMIDCYKDINGRREYVQCVAVIAKNGTDMYIYNKNSFKYSKIDMKYFARAVKNGLIIHNYKIPGLKKAMDDIDKEESDKQL